jgi:hypothetical protein
MAAIKSLSIFLVVVVLGFFMWKFGSVYIDVNGIESDLGNYSGDILVECIGDPYCEDDVIEQIEMVREHNNRKVTLDYETLDYVGGANVIKLEGYKEVDLIFTKYVYHFTITVDVWR